jgi:hypothetical protein
MNIRMRMAAMAIAGVGALGLGVGTAGAALAGTGSGTVTAVTHEFNTPDTTSGTVTSNPGTGFGYIWAYDNLAKQFKVTFNGGTTYTVVETVNGSFAAFSEPNTGFPYDTPITVTGSVQGTNTYTVQSSTPPDASGLPAQVPSSMSTGDMINALFGGNANIGGGNVWVFTYRAGGNTMTQSYNTPPSDWGNITG